MSPHAGVVIESAAERAYQLRSLALSLGDVMEQVPAGESATCMRHDANLFAAPGVNLRVSEGETLRESGAL